MEAKLRGTLVALHPEDTSTFTFSAAYDQFFPFVWRNLRRLGVAEDSVEDALQDVFVVVHRRWADFHVGQSSFRSWLFGIVMRVARDYRRTCARRDPATRSAKDIVDPDSVAYGGTDPQECAELAERVETLHAILRELGAKKRTILILVELEQMTAPEIADVLDIPLNTVYSRLRAARHAFDLALARSRENQGDV
jgi:RNA polymerase sigma-70 factor (ECF subfamily)